MARAQRQQSSERSIQRSHGRGGELVEIATARANREPGRARLRRALVDSDWGTYLLGLGVGAMIAAALLALVAKLV